MSAPGRWLSVAVAALSLVACTPRTTTPAAAPDAAVHRGVVILVSAAAHLPVSLKTSEQLLAAHGADEASIVVCGKALAAAKRDSPDLPLLQRAISHGVRVVACGISMHKLGVRAADLAPGVVSVPNGLIEVIRLQRLGFASVEI